MSRPNDGIYYRLDWISRAYTDDVSFVDGCSSPTSLQYMRELNPIYLQRPRPVLPLPHQLGPRHCLV
eukprot:XP_001699609.1 predicted protein [Chlamydomonas reinhardtii]